MASNIVPGNVDGTYPKAGQDNSSQGFRDNFNSIQSNFTEAKTEIEALQTNKANLNASSDFADNEVTRATFKDTAEKVGKKAKSTSKPKKSAVKKTTKKAGKKLTTKKK